MKSSEYQSLRTHTLLVHLNGDASTVIFNCRRAILLKGHIYPVTISCQVLIYGIVHNLIYEMIQSLARNRTDIHSGALPYGLQSLKDRNIGCIIIVLTCHTYLIFYDNSQNLTI